MNRGGDAAEQILGDQSGARAWRSGMADSAHGVCYKDVCLQRSVRKQARRCGLRLDLQHSEGEV